MTAASSGVVGPQADPTKLGESGHARLKADAYWTEPWVTEALLKVWRPAGAVWEMACGTGQMVQALRHKGYTVVASDLHDWGSPHFHLHNFLADSFGVGSLGEDLALEGARTLMTNPPFDQAEAFIRKGLAIIKGRDGQLALLLRVDFDSATRRQCFFKREPTYALKVILTRRPRWVVETGSPRFNYAWYIWDARHRGPPTIAYSQ